MIYISCVSFQPGILNRTRIRKPLIFHAMAFQQNWIIGLPGAQSLISTPNPLVDTFKYLGNDLNQ